MKKQIQHFGLPIMGSLYTNIVLFILCLIITSSALGQSNGKKKIFAIAHADGRAFVYHSLNIPLSYGFNVYRSPDGTTWTKLTEQPFYPAGDGFEFRQIVAEDYQYLTQILDEDDPMAIFLRLRSGSNMAKITSMTIPSVARAVGRLYIDEKAPVGETVWYRFEMVDIMGKLTGEEIKGRVNLQPYTPPQVTGVQVKNEGPRVTVNWNYLPNDDAQARYVIRFDIYYKKEGSDELFKANQRFQARTIEDNKFRYIFELKQELGGDYTFFVYAYDFTGQMSEPSQPVTVLLADNIPPSIIRGIEASVTKDYKSLITWPVSPELDLAGYHIYRVSGDSKKYNKITTEFLPALSVAYIDSTVKAGTLYKYKVTAVDKSGNESIKSNARDVYIVDYRVPEPVTSFSAVYDKDTDDIYLNWSAGEVKMGIENYLLLRRQTVPKSGTVFTQLNGSDFIDTTFTDKGVGGTRFVDGTVYQYGIAIVGENGKNSDTLFTEVKIPDLTPPEPPSYIDATMQLGQRVSLTWNASLSKDVVLFRVYRSEESQKDTLLAELPMRTRYFRDERVGFGNTFIYSVTAVDSLGNESTSAPIDTLATHPLHPPVAVRNVQAIEMEKGVVLAWEASTDENVVGYQIYKSSIPTGIYDLIGKTKDTRWTDTNGEAGEWYKVFPIDATGRESRKAPATQALEEY